MKLPVIEQIARKIEARLRTVTAGNGYARTVEDVIRPRRRNDYTPADGVTVLELTGFDGGTDETDTDGIKLNRTALWSITHFIEPSDADGTPLDALQVLAIAEIERALAEDYYFDPSGTFAGPGGFAGIGTNAELRLPEFLDGESGPVGVIVNLAVSYRHADNDPYTPL